MSYLDTIGWCEECAQERKEYIDSIEQCDCHHVDGDGFLGWFHTLSECVAQYPTATQGMSFVNIETRSVWLYDGSHWRNTTQGNPFHLIYDIEHAGEVKKGFAQTFYYIPTEDDVRGGTITFHFLIDGNDIWVECDVEYLSDIVFIEWNGSVFVSRVRSLDERVAYVEGNNIVDGQGRVVVDSNAIESAIDEFGKKIEAEKNRAEEAEAGIDRIVVKHNAQSLTDAQKKQARKNIAAAAEQALIEVEKSVDNIRDVLSHFQSDTQIGLSWLSANTLQSVEQSLTDAQKKQARKNIGAVTEKNGKLYDANNQQFSPYTDALNVYCGSLGYLETALSNIISKLDNVKGDVDAFFNDANLSESAKDTLKEIQEYIDSDVQAAAQMLANINELRTSLNTKVNTNGGDVSNTIVKIDGDDNVLSELLVEIAEGVSSLYEDFVNIATAIEKEAKKISNVNLVLTVENILDDEDDSVINQQLRAWISGKLPEGKYKFRLMRNLSGGRTTRNNGWRPVSISNDSALQNHERYKPLDYIEFKLNTSFSNSSPSMRGEIIDVNAKDMFEQLCYYVGESGLRIRSGFSAVTSIEDNCKVNVTNLGLALYRYDDDGKAVERVSNIAEFGITADIYSVVDGQMEGVQCHYNMFNQKINIPFDRIMIFPKQD